MRYNFKSKKGFINNIVTQQGEGYVTSEESKKGANDELYLRHGRYTTCDNHEHPHFYLKLSMAKVRPKKMWFSVLPSWWWRMCRCLSLFLSDFSV